MKKNYKKVKLFSVLAILFVAFGVKAQFLAFTVNNGINYQCFNGGTNTASCAVTSTPAGTTSYSWSVISSPCGITYTAVAPNASSINMTFPCTGMYSISCVAMNGSSVTGVQFSQFYIYANPTISISNSSSTLCAGSAATLSSSGAMYYTWSIGATGSQIIVSPSVNTCYSVSGTDAQGCTSMASSCLTIQTTNVLISASSQTICKGSSASLSVSGTASSYTWNTSATTSTLNVLPNVTTSYSVSGTGSNGCIGMDFITLFVDSMCSDVWPGDANNDGVVTSGDVFEIGLAFGNTGSARTPGGNSYTSQYANNWMGTVSTGKNKCHADCNGDGTVNMSDTLAIFNNFSLTHSFKPADSSTNPDIKLVSPEGVGGSGWNFATIELGNSLTAPISQLYGVAFDVNYDKNLIVQDSAYIVYLPSFLNSANQNVEFRKPDFTNGKIYATSVRTDGSNVSGSGVIGQFWFKVSSGFVNHTPLNLSISNVTKIDKNGVSAVLAGGSTQVDLLTVGISELEIFKNSIQFYPNPAKDKLFVTANGGQKVNYSILDISGREITNGDYIDSKIIDLSDYSAGTYILRFESKNLTAHKKLILEK